MTKALKKKAERLLEVSKKLEASKALYSERDELIEELVDGGVNSYKGKMRTFIINDLLLEKSKVWSGHYFNRYKLTVK